MFGRVRFGAQAMRRASSLAGSSRAGLRTCRGPEMMSSKSASLAGACASSSTVGGARLTIEPRMMAVDASGFLDLLAEDDDDDDGR